jgi:protein involved in polysaccharide export with SLBB domain
MRRILLFLFFLCLSACSLPAKIGMPEGDILRIGHQRFAELTRLPPPATRITPGDTLRIVRDAQEPAEKDDMNLFVVRPDGNIAVPFVGIIRAAELTPEALAGQITERLAPIYHQPEVTVNIAEAPGNRVFIGGEIHNPSVYPLNGKVTIEQALIAAGGVLPSADSKNIALLREDEQGVYQLYFFNYARLIAASGKEEYRPLVLQRGDVIFVPKSGIGNAIEAVDLYFTRLFPINKGIGVGLNYDLNHRDNSVNYKISP